MLDQQTELAAGIGHYDHSVELTEIFVEGEVFFARYHCYTCNRLIVFEYVEGVAESDEFDDE